MTTSDYWNTEQLIQSSLKLANGYCPGSVASGRGGQNGRKLWTPDRLTRYGAALSRGYGVGL